MNNQLILNRNAVVEIFDCTVSLRLRERQVNVVVGKRFYLILTALIECGITFEYFSSPSLAEVENLIKALRFNDILLMKDEDECFSTGLLRSPARTDCVAHPIPEDALDTWCLFGAPADFARDPPRSPLHGPYIYRKFGSVHGSMIDLGDVVFSTVDNIHSFGKKISHIISRIYEKGNRGLMIGGDHSLTYFSVKQIATLEKELLLIHFDAHSDMAQNDNNGKNPLTHSNFISKLIIEKIILQVIQIGVRDSMAAYFDAAHNTNSIVRFGTNPSSQEQSKLRSLLKNKTVYITFDMDVLDPEYFPHVTTPLGDGMRPEIALQLLKLVRSSAHQIIGADLVEFTGGFDERGNIFNNEMHIVDSILNQISESPTVDRCEEIGC